MEEQYEHISNVMKEIYKLDNYSACRRRGGVLNSPRLNFFSVSQVGAALMGDTAGHKPHEPT